MTDRTEGLTPERVEALDRLENGLLAVARQLRTHAEDEDRIILPQNSAGVVEKAAATIANLRAEVEAAQTASIHNAKAARREACRDGWVDPGREWADPTSVLVLEPLRWAWELRDSLEWVACEQVPPVYELWRHMADVLRSWGFDATAVKLNAEEYGVPQTRTRAFLLAHRDRVTIPKPTHQRYVKGIAAGAAPECQPSLFGHGRLPWVSMAEALGWGYLERPTNTVRSHTGGLNPITGGSGAKEAYRSAMEEGTFKVRDSRGEGHERSPEFDPEERPSRTVGEKARSWEVTGELNTGRDWKKGEGRDSAQRIPLTEPAPTIGGTNLRAWHLNPGQTPTQPNRRLYSLDEPAPSIGFGHDRANWRWELRAGTGENDVARDEVEPAHTMRFGKRLNTVAWTKDRPATTVAGDPRVHPPGHKQNSNDPPGKYDGRAGENAIRIQIEEAAVLQSFPPDYPWQGSMTSQFTQVGNAVPPRLAAHVLRALITGEA